MSLRFRKGESNLDEWKWLLIRDPSNVTNISEFSNAIGLFYSHNKAATYTQEQLTKLQQSVAHMNARHSSTVAKSMTANEISGLEPAVFLAKGAKVILTMNLWASVSLCDGATETVIDIIYEINH